MDIQICRFPCTVATLFLYLFKNVYLKTVVSLPTNDVYNAGDDNSRLHSQMIQKFRMATNLLS